MPASTQTLDNFWVATYVPDAAVFASEQIEIRHDGAIRQDSTGSVWVDKVIQGDHLTIPPAGREGRSVRVIVKASRNDLTTGADSAIDDITGQLIFTPRGLSLPE